MYRVQMKNSACVGCVQLLNFHLEAPFSRYISFLNICKYHAKFDLYRNAVNASESDAVIFTGSGTTGAVHALVSALDLKGSNRY